MVVESDYEVRYEQVVGVIEGIVRDARVNLRDRLPDILDSIEAEIDTFAKSCRGVQDVKKRKDVLRQVRNLSRFYEPFGKHFAYLESGVEKRIATLPKHLQDIYSVVFNVLCSALFEKEEGLMVPNEFGRGVSGEQDDWELPVGRPSEHFAFDDDTLDFGDYRDY